MLKIIIFFTLFFATLALPQEIKIITEKEMLAKSAGCISCHAKIEPMHRNRAVKIGCTDCHGGDATSFTKETAHPPDHFGMASSNPPRLYNETLKWSYDLLKFVNPGDLRVADETCGSCHPAQTARVKSSMMTHSALLWGGAAYNNGILPLKNYVLGESYGAREKETRYERDAGNFSAMIYGPAYRALPTMLRQTPAPDSIIQKNFGVLPFLLPLPRWNITQPPDNFRSFERGGRIARINPSDIGLPNPLEDPGKPDNKLSDRGLGTQLLISSPVLNVHKTRLNDPHLSFFGTNDHPGDYRSSGCSACHVVYANDRAWAHAGPYARFGNRGHSFSADTTQRGKSPNPIIHQFTRAIPSSQCMVCHMHQPNGFLNTYYGYQMWDYESGGEQFYSNTNRDKSQDFDRLDANPEEAVLRGEWANPEFLAEVSNLNAIAKGAQFADYHGHGWNFRAVFKRDRKGNLLDKDGKIIPDIEHALHGIATIYGSRFCDQVQGKTARQRAECRTAQKAVHLLDIHAEKGMHCVDCHFEKDSHGNGNLYGEFHNAIEIQCADCHGDARGQARLRTSGIPSKIAGTTDMTRLRTPWGRPRFYRLGEDIYQRSMLYDSLEWKISSFATATNEKAMRAHFLAKDGSAQNGFIKPLAHAPERMDCSSCHNSWITNCFGCHLPQQANWKKTQNHYEGGESRNWTTYNPQVLRDDALMLCLGPSTKGNKISPARSSSALMLSSRNANREQIYNQQAPISAAGFSSQAFNSHVPHTVRKVETRGCNDCHLSEQNDNNAWLAQVLLQGTGMVNFMGKYAWVAAGTHGLSAVKVTEDDEPQAVIGSYLHGLAFKQEFARHQANGLELATEYSHHGSEVLDLQLRGEYLFAACGTEGLRVYDVANIDNKGFSERIVTSPVSPFGQQTRVDTEFATAIALPTNMPIDVDQNVWIRKNHPENLESQLHDLYRYIYVADREEGLVIVDTMPLVDRDPRNNFLKRALAFNPNNALRNAKSIAIAGNYLYVCAQLGLAVIDLATPLAPKLLKVVRLNDARAVAIQLNYAFIADGEGVKVFDISDPLRIHQTGKSIRLANAGKIYLARTYAYVASGKDGITVIDIEKPEAAFIDQKIINGEMDVRDVKIAASYASVFMYVADAKQGLLVFQLLSPENATYLGFSPRPVPRLIARRHLSGAVALSRGMDRDRAVDESGNQISVFGRLGASPAQKKIIIRK